MVEHYYRALDPVERHEAELERSPPFHVVRITADGYWLLSSHELRETAVDAALSAARAAHDPVVLRDGRTGKRFSIAELRS